jgi:hypothetical protein
LSGRQTARAIVGHNRRFAGETDFPEAQGLFGMIKRGFALALGLF